MYKNFQSKKRQDFYFNGTGHKITISICVFSMIFVEMLNNIYIFYWLLLYVFIL